MLERILTNNYVKEFQELIDQASSVSIATGWLTDNEAFNYLLNKEVCKLRIITGTRDYKTDDECLQKIIDTHTSTSLRFINPEERLFHPKVYIFDLRHKSITWIGSANFTKGGFERNSEIFLQTADSAIVKQLAHWFDEQWDQLKEQDVCKDLLVYREERKSRKVKGKLVNPDGDDDSPDVRFPREGSVKEIYITPSSKRKKGQPCTGEIRFVFWTNKKLTCTHESTEDAVHKVLKLLIGHDEELLRTCEDDKRFQIDHRKYKVVSQLLAHKDNERRLYENRSRDGYLGDTGLNRAHSTPKKLVKDWFLSNDIGQYYAERLIRACCDIVDVPIHTDPKMFSD